MPVIKRSNPSRSVDHAVVLDLGDLAAEARRIRDEARRDAEQLLEQARARGRADAEQARAEAAEDGRRTGYADGLEEGQAAGHAAVVEELRPRLEELTRQWSGAIAQWESQRQAMLRQAREDVLVFAFELARRVVHRTIRNDPAVAADQLRDALALVSRPTAVEVAVAPDDRPLLEEVLPDLLGQFKHCTEVRLHDDASVGRGGCVVRTAGGTIDARIETQLDRIAKTLLPAHPGGTESTEEAPRE